MEIIKTNTPEDILPVLIQDEEKITITEPHFGNSVFENRLKEFYWTKRKFIKLLDLLIRKSDSEDLRDVLEEYQVITHRQLRRTEDLFYSFYIIPSVKINEKVKNAITEICGKIQEPSVGKNSDTEIINTILKIEEYWNSSFSLLLELTRNKMDERITNYLDETEKEGNLLLSRFSFFSEKI